MTGREIWRVMAEAALLTVALVVVLGILGALFGAVVFGGPPR